MPHCLLKKTSILKLRLLSIAASWLVAATSAVAGTDVAVNSGTSGVQNEVSITLNPAQPGNVVIAYNDTPSAQSTQGLGVSFSTDNGQTWTDRQIGVPAPTDPFGAASLSDIFDPITGADTQGNVLAGYIATDGSQGGPSGVYIHRSADGGNTWTSEISVHSNAAEAFPGDPGYRFNDKPHLEVDRFAASPRQDDAYIAWIQDDGQTAPSNIVFSATTDAGNTWFGSPVVVNDNLGGPNTDMANGPNVAAAPNGDVYVAWLDVDVTNNAPGPKAGTLFIDRSTDGGATWGPDMLVRNVSTLPNHLSTFNNQANQDDVRARGYPVLAADPNDPQGDTLYLVYAEDPDGTIAGDEADIFFLKSSDGGVNWSANPLKLNDDATINDQFAPWMAVKPNGLIDVVWYDKRNDLGDAQWDVYFTSSSDGGVTFSPNLRISDTSFATALSSGNEPWLGEYLGIAVDGTHAYIGFTSSISDTSGDIFFDRIVNPTGQFVIPEPSSQFAWLGLFGLVSAARRRRKRR